MNDIGFWDFVRQRMPHSRFLTQSDRFGFSELVRSSTLPSFNTDLAKKYLDAESNRIEVPVSNPEASVTYYLVCLREAKQEFHGLFAAL